MKIIILSTIFFISMLIMYMNKKNKRKAISNAKKMERKRLEVELQLGLEEKELNNELE